MAVCDCAGDIGRIGGGVVPIAAGGPTLTRDRVEAGINRRNALCATLMSKQGASFPKSALKETIQYALP